MNYFYFGVFLIFCYHYLFVFINRMCKVPIHTPHQKLFVNRNKTSRNRRRRVTCGKWHFNRVLGEKVTEPLKRVETV